MNFRPRMGFRVMMARLEQSRPDLSAFRWVGAFVVLLYCALMPVSGASFIESAGQVVIEAEHFQSNSIGSGHSWVATNDVPGFAGGSAMQAQPDNGANLSSVAGSPLLTYSVQLTNSGDFNLW